MAAPMTLRLRWLWAPVILFLGLAAPAAAKPQRVVSLNMCADQLVVLLLEPERIAALSYLSRDPELSYVARQAETLPVTSDEAEDVLRRRPDLVLAGPFGKAPTLRLLQARGIPVVHTKLPQDFDAIAAQIEIVAAALGEPARGAALVAEMRASLAALPPADGRAASALIYQADGFTAGSGTLGDAVLRAAGLRNFAADAGLVGYGYLGLERAVAGHPDFLIADTKPENRPSLADTFLQHPALRHMGAVQLHVTPALWACGGPFTALAATHIALARRDLD